ncbi:MAG: histidinol dehydrogenase [Sphingobacteriales bacterium JAD_PAG50586_3]|nr:MAG: histidinol dehydrogenase [Sphingobacteriales bacterium JAD_PAG50586_3]
MKVIKYPKQAQLKALLTRPQPDTDKVENAIKTILTSVKQKGDKALIDYTYQFDNVKLTSLKVSAKELADAEKQLPANLKKAIKTAQANIKKFHKAQQQKPVKIETTKGVVCWRESRPIEKVGLYIPGGSAPLFSTVLMLATPAAIAGCKRVVLCTPADKEGKVNPAILFSAQLCGVTEIYKVGGAQAIAAMAYGTETIKPVNKIFGPGNRYVTTAKQLVQNDGVAIDMPAGPSEVMVVADNTAIPAFVAADLLSQAEHGPDSQVVLVAFNELFIEAVQQEVIVQLAALPRQDIAIQALENSKIILVKTEQDAIQIINEYAPEHLILAVKNENYFVQNTINAGSIFIGNYTPESAGDYASGTNHTLPTNGYAKVYGGVSLDSFVKKITVQKISAQGIKNLGSTIEIMAAAEGLDAHKNAVTIRLNQLKK